VTTQNRQCRVLVVDDNHDFADSFAEILDTRGYDTTVCYDGLRGRDVLLSLRPDVAVLDIGMPGLNGFELATIARASIGLDLLMIAVTGWTEPEHKRQARDVGFNFHVAKPPDPAHVVGLIQEWMRGKSGPRSSPIS
jgi:CheY-like chemotaxis protein